MKRQRISPCHVSVYSLTHISIYHGITDNTVRATTPINSREQITNDQYLRQFSALEHHNIHNFSSLEWHFPSPFHSFLKFGENGTPLFIAFKSNFLFSLFLGPLTVWVKENKIQLYYSIKNLINDVSRQILRLLFVILVNKSHFHASGVSSASPLLNQSVSEREDFSSREN